MHRGRTELRRSRLLREERQRGRLSSDDLRRRRAVVVISWLSFALGVSGLILAAIPNIFFSGAFLFIPGFILGLVALALRSKRVWAAVVGIVAAALAANVMVVSGVVTVVILAGSIAIPNFDINSLLKGIDLSSITKGLNLSDLTKGLNLASLTKGLKLPNLGSLGIPKAAKVDSMIASIKKTKAQPVVPALPGEKSKSTKTPKPTSTATKTPTASPTSDPTQVFAVGEVFTDGEGASMTIFSVECGITSIPRDGQDLAPVGQFCSAMVVVSNTGSTPLTFGTTDFQIVAGAEDIPADLPASGIWEVDADGNPVETSEYWSDGTPVPLDEITLDAGHFAIATISFDVPLDDASAPTFLMIQGSMFPRAVLVTLATN